MTLTPPTIETILARLEEAASDLRSLRINAYSIPEAIETKIDVERALLRVLRDLKARAASI